MNKTSQKIPDKAQQEVNNGLLFQFLLSDFIEAHEESRKLTLIGGDAEEEIQAALLKLLGGSQSGLSTFWSFADGLLNKLHGHALLLLETSEQYEKELLALHYYIDKIRMACSHALNALKTDARTELRSALDKALIGMQRLSKLIPRMIQQFKDDENVIFFLLRHKTQFDRIYGNRFVQKTLGRMFPKGLHEVRQLLAQKYLNRGFDNLLQLIDSTLSALDDCK